MARWLLAWIVVVLFLASTIVPSPPGPRAGGRPSDDARLPAPAPSIVGLSRQVPDATSAPITAPGPRQDHAAAPSTPKPTLRMATTPTRLSGHLRGPASWYCLPGRSACTVHYAANGRYAAAGPRLRRALGQSWMGRVVYVNGLRVVLADWCQCGGGRVLDLYAGVFDDVAPLARGLVAVDVTW